MAKKKLKSKEMLDYYTFEQLKEIVDEEYGLMLAHKLAESGKWLTNYKKVLRLETKYGKTVAHYLAEHNSEWVTYDRNILHWHDGDYTVAHYLAMYNPNFDPDKADLDLSCIGGEDEEPLALTLAKNGKLFTHSYWTLCERDYYYTSVAHVLARREPKWMTYDVRVLELIDYWDESVAEALAQNNPAWSYYNLNFVYYAKIKKILIAKKKYIARRRKKNVLTIIPII